MSRDWDVRVERTGAVWLSHMGRLHSPDLNTTASLWSFDAQTETLCFGWWSPSFPFTLLSQPALSEILGVIINELEVCFVCVSWHSGLNQQHSSEKRM